ncbi:hypothetical protein IWZ01DRAFT_51998 [Phyllosticta capitalensis]
MRSARQASEAHAHASSSLLSYEPSATDEAKPTRREHVKKHNGSWITFTALVLFSAVAVLVSLILWVCLAIRDNASMSFSPQKIGGSFSLSQAKAIDVAFSILVFPCLIAALNFVWFTSARVSAVNELQSPGRRGVPLATLIEASTTTSGSYDILRIIALLRGKSWRLLLLAMMVLLSAVAKSTLSNIIAYEAFSSNSTSSADIRLRYLSDTYLNRRATNYTDQNIDFGSSQSEMVAKLEKFLTDITLAPSMSFQDDTYIGVNATAASMDSINSNITELHDVPGFRLTVNCTNDKPFGLTLVAQDDGLKRIDVDLDGVGYYAQFFGSMDQLDFTQSTADTESYSFAAFQSRPISDTAKTQFGVYLGFVGDNHFPTDSPYGEIPVGKSTAYNVIATTPKVVSDQRTRDFYGIKCSLYRSEGKLDFSRNSTNAWNLKKSTFSDQQTEVPSFLAQWQSIDYSAPGAPINGIGPALSATANDSWSALAKTFLYASGEVQKIGYEFAASNLSREEPDFFYNVGATQSSQRYRITYVPVLLLIGLLAALAAAAITAAMAVYTARTVSARTFRLVDPLRLVIDCGQGLQEAIQDLAASAPHSLPSDRLEKWAQGLVVAYAEVDENGELAVRLRPNYTKEE